MPNTSISFPASPAVNQQYTYGTTTYVYTGTNWAVYVSSASLPSFVTSANIVDGTIVNADINASAAIDGSKISPVFTSASTFSSTLGVTGATTLASVGVTGAATIQGLTVGKGGGTITSNTAVGYTALYDNTTGSDNTAVGFAALRYNTTSSSNSAFGVSALLNNTTSSNNSAFGYAALFNNVSGSNNNAFGYAALLNSTTSSYNNAFGNSALLLNTTGYNNTAIGQDALGANTTGFQNTAVGMKALVVLAAGTENTAVGYSAGELCANGSFNTFIGNGAGALLTSGSNNTCIGFNTQLTTNTTSNEINLGNGSIATFRCQVALTVVSDERDKTNIVDIPVGLNLISKIRPVSFEWNQRDGNRIGRKEFGFTAQQLQTAQTDIGIEVPYLVNNDNLENLGVSPTQLIPVLVKAIQELNAKFEAYVATHP